jgi:hypothetical protein
MAYAVCGHTGCILDGIRRVLSMAGADSENYVSACHGGIWGQSTYNRPALETQMEAIRRADAPGSIRSATLPIPGRIRNLIGSGSFARYSSRPEPGVGAGPLAMALPASQPVVQAF